MSPHPPQQWLSILGLIALLMLSAPGAEARQHVRFGDLEVHYVVLNTTDVSPEMAERYALTRAADRGLINIAGRRRGDDGTTSAVQLAIEGTVTNLLGQSRSLQFREVTDPAAIYYLETIAFTDREPLRFQLQVTDLDTGRRHPVSFEKILWRQ